MQRGILIVLALFLGTAGHGEEDPRVLLSEMATAVAGLERFRVDGEAYTDARLAAGQLVEHAAAVTVRVRRPDALRVTLRTADNTKEIYFGDETLTLFSETEMFYGQTAIPADIDAAVSYAVDEIGIDAPLLDFVVSDIDEGFLADATDVAYFGVSLVRGRAHHHVGIRKPEIDLQVWLSVDEPRLPGKLTMISKWEGGAPRFVAFLEWDTDPDIPTGVLRFEPPAGSAKIDILRAADR